MRAKSVQKMLQKPVLKTGIHSSVMRQASGHGMAADHVLESSASTCASHIIYI